MMPRISKLRLLSALRLLLAQTDTTVKKRRAKWCGEMSYELNEQGKPYKISITMDPRRDGTVTLVIHELLHIWIQHHLGLEGRMTYELEEAAVLAWEHKLYAWLHDPKRARELESWSRAIERKLA